MVKYTNLRPLEPTDSLRRLLQRIDNHSTVPYGQKVAGADEGTTYFTTTGDAMRWDGDTLATYDARISEATQAVAEAKADLVKAEENLAASAARQDEAASSLAAQDKRVTSAEKTLEQAKKDLSSLTSTTTVQGQRLTGLETASSAQQDRLDALAQASKAVDAKASEAVASAQSAAADLERIQQQIRDAASSGTATTAQVQQAAQAAQAAAEAAAKQARDALAAANAAHASADGRTTTTYTATAPPGVGLVAGDTHYRVTSAGVVLAWWRWDGKSWVQQSLDGAVLSSLDAGKITAGTLDAARIAAGSITTDKLLVGIGDEVVVNGDARAEGVWGGKWSRMAEDPPSWGLTSTDGALVREYTPRFPVPAGGGPFRLRFKVRAEHKDTAIFVRRTSTTATGVDDKAVLVTTARHIADAGKWMEFTADDVLPADATSVMFWVWANAEPGAQAADTTRFKGFSYRPLVSGELIVNGAVTAEKVNAQSVAGAVGDFVKVKATNVEVTGDLASRVVRSMTSETKKLVVTEEAVLAHATLLGTTVAEQLNVTKRLRARDAIIDGTLDVAQLNVTEGMSAAIVRAMTTESKRLIVTEDAILQRATVIENLVTPQLIAKRVDVQDLGARLITSGSIQTDAATNRGVKISNAGIQAWDNTGVRTLSLNGKNNELIGDFSTVNAAGTGVKINSNDSVSQINLFSSTAGGGPTNLPDRGIIRFDIGSYLPYRGLKIFGTAQTDGNYSTSDPGMALRTSTKAIDFYGKIGRQGTAMQTGVETANSAVVGGWVKLDVTFTTPMTPGTSVAVFISPINETGAECAIGLTEVNTTGFKANVVNKSTRATGKQWLHWMAVAI